MRCPSAALFFEQIKFTITQNEILERAAAPAHSKVIFGGHFHANPANLESRTNCASMPLTNHHCFNFIGPSSKS
jgi:hypothetical protein